MAMDEEQDPLVNALRAEAAAARMRGVDDDERDPLVRALRTEAARIAPRARVGLAERARARALAAPAGRQPLRFLWLAAAASFVAGIVFAATYAPVDHDGDVATPPVAIAPPPAPLRDLGAPVE